MKTAPTYLASLLLALTIGACADEPEPSGTYAGEITQENLLDLDDAIACDAETPCENALECL